MTSLLKKLDEGLDVDSLNFLMAELNCLIELKKMPLNIRGLTVKLNDSYTIYINNSLCDECKKKTLKHEVLHIMRGDFTDDISAEAKESLVCQYLSIK